MYVIRYLCHILMKLEFSRQSFDKNSNINISWRSVLWEQSSSMRTNGRTDRQKDIQAWWS